MSISGLALLGTLSLGLAFGTIPKTLASCADNLGGFPDEPDPHRDAVAQLSAAGYSAILAPASVEELSMFHGVLPPQDVILLGAQHQGRAIDRSFQPIEIIFDNKVERRVPVIGLVFSVNALKTVQHFVVQIDNEEMARTFEPAEHRSSGLQKLIAMAKDPKVKLDALVTELPLENLRGVIVPKVVKSDSPEFELVANFVRKVAPDAHLMHWAKFGDLGFIATFDQPE